MYFFFLYLDQVHFSSVQEADIGLEGTHVASSILRSSKIIKIAFKHSPQNQSCGNRLGIHLSTCNAIENSSETSLIKYFNKM